MVMKFCDKCGSYMKKTRNGFVCRKCGNLTCANTGMHKIGIKKMEHSGLIHVVDATSKDEHLKVAEVCPKCGSKEAFQRFSRVSGEHAGIRRERTIEHLKCTKCSHSWSKTS